MNAVISSEKECFGVTSVPQQLPQRLTWRTLQCAGEIGELRRIHMRSQTVMTVHLSASLHSLWLVQSHLCSWKKGPRCFSITPWNLTWCCRGGQCRQQAGALWLKCHLLAKNIMSLSRSKNLGVSAEKKELYFTSFSLTSIFYICYQPF